MKNTLRSLTAALLLGTGLAATVLSDQTNEFKITTNPSFSYKVDGSKVVKFSALIPWPGIYSAEVKTDLTADVWYTATNSIGQSTFANAKTNGQMNFAYPVANLPPSLTESYFFRITGNTNSVPN